MIRKIRKQIERVILFPNNLLERYASRSVINLVAVAFVLALALFWALAASFLTENLFHWNGRGLVIFWLVGMILTSWLVAALVFNRMK